MNLLRAAVSGSSIRRLVWALVWCSVSTAACVPREVRFSQPPIILVNIDTLRADHLGCYGYQRPTSPQLDAFSTSSSRFEWAYSQAPNTPPSQASILTGLYPSSHGRIRKHHVLPDEVVTLAESLRHSGYATAAFVDGGLMAAGFGLEQGFDLYDDAAGGVERIGPKVRQWIRGHLSSNDRRSKPFFLLIHSYDVHSPYEKSPWQYRSMFLDGLDLPSREFRSSLSQRMFKVWNSRTSKQPLELTESQLDYAKAKYDSGIRHVDDWFGSFREFLEKYGIFDQAIVVVISDHGDEFQEHGSLFHDRLYSTVTRIPLIVRFPDGRVRGVFDQVVESIDLMPTLLEVVGAELPAGIQGRSLLPILEGKEQLPRTAISESPIGGPHIAVTRPELRLVGRRQGKVEIYRYRSDPLEQEDLAEQLPDATRRMIEMIRGWEQSVESHRFQAETRQQIDPLAEEQLRELGYLQ